MTNAADTSPSTEEQRITKAMYDLRQTTNQPAFVEAFMAVMGVEPDGVRVRMNLTWPRPKKEPKPAKTKGKR